MSKKYVIVALHVHAVPAGEVSDAETGPCATCDKSEPEIPATLAD